MKREDTFVYHVPFRFVLDGNAEFDSNDKDLNAFNYWFNVFDDGEIEIYNNEEKEPMFIIKGYELSDILYHNNEFENEFKDKIQIYLDFIEYFEYDSSLTEDDAEFINYQIIEEPMKYIWDDENEEFVRKDWV